MISGISQVSGTRWMTPGKLFTGLLYLMGSVRDHGTSVAHGIDPTPKTYHNPCNPYTNNLELDRHLDCQNLHKFMTPVSYQKGTTITSLTDKPITWLTDKTITWLKDKKIGKFADMAAPRDTSIGSTAPEAVIRTGAPDKAPEPNISANLTSSPLTNMDPVDGNQALVPYRNDTGSASSEPHPASKPETGLSPDIKTNSSKDSITVRGDRTDNTQALVPYTGQPATSINQNQGLRGDRTDNSQALVPYTGQPATQEEMDKLAILKADTKWWNDFWNGKITDISTMPAPMRHYGNKGPTTAQAPIHFNGFIALSILYSIWNKMNSGTITLPQDIMSDLNLFGRRINNYIIRWNNARDGIITLKTLSKKSTDPAKAYSTNQGTAILNALRGYYGNIHPATVLLLCSLLNRIYKAYHTGIPMHFFSGSHRARPTDPAISTSSIRLKSDDMPTKELSAATSGTKASTPPDPIVTVTSVPTPVKEDKVHTTKSDENLNPPLNNVQDFKKTTPSPVTEPNLVSEDIINGPANILTMLPSMIYDLGTGPASGNTDKFTSIVTNTTSRDSINNTSESIGIFAPSNTPQLVGSQIMIFKNNNELLNNILGRILNALKKTEESISDPKRLSFLTYVDNGSDTSKGAPSEEITSQPEVDQSEPIEDQNDPKIIIGQPLLKKQSKPSVQLSSPGLN